MDASYTDAELTELAERAIESLSRESVIAEINFGRFVRDVLDLEETAARELLKDLRAYLDGVR